jgi:hypothetical protein
MALATDTQEQLVLEDTVIKGVRDTEDMVTRVAQAMVIRELPVMELMDTRDHRVLEDMVTSQHHGPEGMDHRAGNIF